MQSLVNLHSLIPYVTELTNLYDSMDNYIRGIEGECMKHTKHRRTFKWQLYWIQFPQHRRKKHGTWFGGDEKWNLLLLRNTIQHDNIEAGIMFEIYTKGRSRKSKTANAITKIKRTKGPHWSTKHYSEINRLSIANPTKTGCEPRPSGRVSSSCSTSDSVELLWLQTRW